MPMESIDAVIEMIEKDAVAGTSGVEMLAPGRVGDAVDRQLARLQRYAVRPGVMGHYYRQTMEADLGDMLSTIRKPTLVLNRTGNQIVPLDDSRRVAAAIEGARFVELPGTDHLVFVEGIDRLQDEIEDSSWDTNRIRSRPDPHHAAVHRHRQLDHPSPPS